MRLSHLVDCRKETAYMKQGTVKLIIAAVCVSLLSGISGCAAVSPLKRRNLSDPVMKLHHDEQEKSLNDHIFEKREGGSGSGGSSGGGCGC
jgi:hypothetical protein